MIEKIEITTADDISFHQGYVRNFTNADIVAWTGTWPTDASLTQHFCHCYQQRQVQVEGWPRLKAFPGSIVKPHYQKHGLGPYVNRTYGTISWYGTAERKSPDTRTFAEVLGLQGGLEGDLIYFEPDDFHENSLPSFRVPYSLAVGSFYSVYWLWNTTERVGSSWLVSTSCMDIDIVGTVDIATTVPKVSMSTLLTSSTLSLSNSYHTSRMHGSSSATAFTEVRPTIAPSLHLSESRAGPDASPSMADDPMSLLTAPTCPPFTTSMALGPKDTTQHPTSTLTAKESQATISPPDQPGPDLTSKSAPSRTISRSRTFGGPNTLRTSVPMSITTKSPSPSSWGPISPSSSSRSFTRMVKVIPGVNTEFQPQSLDASVGETIWFYSLNGSFLLHNTTLDSPCTPVARYGDDAHLHVLFRVNNTEPLWLLGQQHPEWYNCSPPSHFSLNPGAYRKEFHDKIDQYIYVSTAQYQRPTFTSTTVVRLYPT
ncbi:hypothetical protein BBP40_004001 [Aspergillus hancockii]|nr:hypothetical protein BBP40_004001 [Aspergillus hancockii]